MANIAQDMAELVVEISTGDEIDIRRAFCEIAAAVAELDARLANVEREVRSG